MVLEKREYRKRQLKQIIFYNMLPHIWVYKESLNIKNL